MNKGLTNQEMYAMWRQSNEANWLMWLDQNIEWVNEPTHDEAFQEVVDAANAEEVQTMGGFLWSA